MWPACQDLIRLQPERQICLFEDLVTLADQLHGESFLPQVIVGLDDDAQELPRLKTRERRILLESCLLLLRRLQEDLVVITVIEKVYATLVCLTGCVGILETFGVNEQSTVATLVLLGILLVLLTGNNRHSSSLAHT